MSDNIRKTWWNQYNIFLCSKLNYIIACDTSSVFCASGTDSSSQKCTREKFWSSTSCTIFEVWTLGANLCLEIIIMLINIEKSRLVAPAAGKTYFPHQKQDWFIPKSTIDIGAGNCTWGELIKTLVPSPPVPESKRRFHIFMKSDEIIWCGNMIVDMDEHYKK